MPVYDLVCRDCETNWETKLQWKEPLPACPECGSDEVRKVYHPAALIFKGSGWHATDYRSNSAGANGANGANGKAESSDSKDTSASKSESGNAAGGGCAGGSCPAKAAD